MFIKSSSSNVFSQLLYQSALRPSSISLLNRLAFVSLTTSSTSTIRKISTKMPASANGTPMSPMGFGLLGLTWRPEPLTDEQAFPVMKEAINRGATCWNAGAFYNLPNQPFANIKLLNRYFTKYPEDADKVVLSVKGGVDVKTIKITNEPEVLKKCIDDVLEILDGKVKLAIFECARIDPALDLHAQLDPIAEYVKAGKVGGIGLSEVGADTIRKAAALYPIAAVEVELSLTSTHTFDLGITAACADLGIPVIAYSPLGMGILSGAFKDAKAGAAKYPHFARFQEDNLNHNFKLYEKVQSIAAAKNATPAQVALAWIKYQSGRFGNPEIIPIPGSTSVNRVIENYTRIELTDEEFKDLDSFAREFEVKGMRYNPHVQKYLNA